MGFPCSRILRLIVTASVDSTPEFWIGCQFLDYLGLRLTITSLHSAMSGEQLQFQRPECALWRDQSAPQEVRVPDSWWCRLNLKNNSRVLGDVDSNFKEHISSRVENLLGDKLVDGDKRVGVELIVSFLKGRRDPNISPRMCEAQTSSNNPIHSISDIKHDARAHICHYLII